MKLEVAGKKIDNQSQIEGRPRIDAEHVHCVGGVWVVCEPVWGGRGGEGVVCEGGDLSCAMVALVKGDAE